MEQPADFLPYWQRIMQAKVPVSPEGWRMEELSADAAAVRMEPHAERLYVRAAPVDTRRNLNGLNAVVDW